MIDAAFDHGRRRCLAGVVAALGGGLGGLRAAAHESVGPVQPALLAPPIRLTDHEGRRHTLPALLVGKVTALQWMFTGCSAVCPLQGAMFSQVQAALSRSHAEGRQLLSVSIDALGDTPQTLQEWRLRFGAAKQWIAAVPAMADLDQLQRAFTDVRRNALDTHSTQVFFFDSQARLQWRSSELPSAAEVEAILGRLG